MLLYPENTKFYETPIKAYQTKGEYRLSSKVSQTLIEKVKNKEFTDEVTLRRNLFCFLNLEEGQDEIF